MALSCSPHVAPEALPRLPVFPGRAQHWSVAYRGNPSIAEPLIVAALRSWLPLFGAGAIVSGVHVDTDPADLPGAPGQSPALPGVDPSPEIGVREPVDIASLRFNLDLEGPASEIRWPTWVAARRDRIDPLCPLQFVDVTPVSVGEPSSRRLFGARLEPAPPALEDPLDLGLPPLPPLPPLPDIVERVESTAKVGLFALLAGSALWLFTRLRPER